MLGKLSQWKVIEVEIDKIERNSTWELLPRPAQWKVIGVMWICKTKYRNDGFVDKYKAQLVAKTYA